MATLPNNYEIKKYIAYENQTDFDIDFIYKDKKDIYFTINKDITERFLSKYSTSIETNWILGGRHSATLILDNPLKEGDEIVIYRKMQVEQIVNYLSNSLVTVEMIRNETENIFLILQDLFENFLDLTDLNKLNELINEEIIPEFPLATELIEGLTRYSTTQETIDGENNSSSVTPLKLKQKLENDIIPLLNKDKTKYLDIGDLVRVHPSKVLRDDTLISPLDGRLIEIGDYKLNNLNGFETKDGTTKISEIGYLSTKFNNQNTEYLCLNDKYVFSGKTMYEYNSYNGMTKIETSSELKQSKYCFYSKDESILHLCNKDGSFTNIDLVDYSVTHSELYTHEDIVFYAILGDIFYTIVKENNLYTLKSSVDNFNWFFEYNISDFAGNDISEFVGKCQKTGTNSFVFDDIFISSISNNFLYKINTLTKNITNVFDTSEYSNNYNYNQLCPKFIDNVGIFHISIEDNINSKILLTQDFGQNWEIKDSSYNLSLINNNNGFFNLNIELINSKGLVMMSYKTFATSGTYYFSSNNFIENSSFGIISNKSHSNKFYFSVYNDKETGFVEENKRINIFTFNNTDYDKSVTYQIVLNRETGNSFVRLPDLSGEDDPEGRFVWALKGK